MDESALSLVSPADLFEGSQYRFVRHIGWGGYSSVCLVQHRMLYSLHVAKVLHMDMASDKQAVERLDREGQVQAQISHPNLVRVTDLGFTDGLLIPYIIMEHIEGWTLDAELSQRKTLDWAEALRIVRQVASAIAYAHGRGILHRDIKPANIFVCHDGTVKVLDWGLMKLHAVSEGISIESQKFPTEPGRYVGTPQYVAPECRIGQAADGRSDIYSIGVVLVEMLVGIKPTELDYDPKSPTVIPVPSRLVPGIPMAVDEIAAKATAMSRSARYQTANELIAAIDAALGGRQPRWTDYAVVGGAGLVTFVGLELARAVVRHLAGW